MKNSMVLSIVVSITKKKNSIAHSCADSLGNFVQSSHFSVNSG